MLPVVSGQIKLNMCLLKRKTIDLTRFDTSKKYGRLYAVIPHSGSKSELMCTEMSNLYVVKHKNKLNICKYLFILFESTQNA